MEGLATAVFNKFANLNDDNTSFAQKLLQEKMAREQNIAQTKALLETFGVKDLSKIPVRSVNPAAGEATFGNYAGVQSFDDIVNSIKNAQGTLVKEGLDNNYDIAATAKGGVIPKLKSKESGTPASILRQQNKDTSGLISVANRNELANSRIQDSINNLDKIPMGKLGQINIGAMKLAGSQDPVIGEWQKLKSLLSDITLGKLQFTKGAISDREMEFFKSAAANDDIQSYPAIKAILQRALEDNSSEIESLKQAYMKNYKEDPSDWLESKRRDANKSVDVNIKSVTTGKTKTGIGWKVEP